MTPIKDIMVQSLNCVASAVEVSHRLVPLETSLCSNYLMKREKSPYHEIRSFFHAVERFPQSPRDELSVLEADEAEKTSHPPGRGNGTSFVLYRGLYAGAEASPQ